MPQRNQSTEIVRSEKNLAKSVADSREQKERGREGLAQSQFQSRGSGTTETLREVTINVDADARTELQTKEVYEYDLERCRCLGPPGQALRCTPGPYDPPPTPDKFLADIIKQGATQIEEAVVEAAFLKATIEGATFAPAALGFAVGKAVIKATMESFPLDRRDPTARHEQDRIRCESLLRPKPPAFRP